MKKIIKKCLYCEKDFVTTRADYCSGKCYRRLKSLNKKQSNNVRDCFVCGESFIVTRIDKKCCNKQCSAIYSNRKRNGYKKFNAKKVCTNCGQEKPLSNFYNVYKTYYAFCKVCFNNNNEDKFLIEKLKVNNFIDVETFLYKIKRQKWMASDADIFDLIDLYDRIYPEDTLTKEEPLEALNDFFFKMAFWYKEKKNEIYKNI